MNTSFPCLPVKVLFNSGYYDGPLSGLCEYNGEKLYFASIEEIMFMFPERDPECIKVCKECNDEPCMDCHRLRIFTLYKFPQDIIDTLIFNYNLFKECRKTSDWERLKKESKPLPSYFNTHKEFLNVAKEWCVGYTTEDVWDDREYWEERAKR